MRIALGVSYRGSAYNGWQSQPNGQTVQDRLQAALSTFADRPVAVQCAGRTDTGVHGIHQVVHLDTDVERLAASWVRGTNRYLPSDIAVQWCRPVAADFHARFSAIGRRYTYVLLESTVRPAIEAGLAGWVFRPMSLEAMADAASRLRGTHDFSAFRSADCQARSPVKEMRAIHVARVGAYWRFDFDASAFLHHMIRNIMGCLVAIGNGSRPVGWMDEVLASRQRAVAAPTFSPAGLYFVGPYYDAAHAIPTSTSAMDWLPRP